jgi:hypothetical protein
MSPSFPSKAQLSATSAGCCLGTTSSLLGLPLKNIPGFHWPVKGDLGLKTPGTYNEPCKCSQVYQTAGPPRLGSRSSSTTCLEHPDSSAKATKGHQTGPLHLTPVHYHLHHKVQIHELDDQRDHQECATPQQLEEGGWPEPEPIM